MRMSAEAKQLIDAVNTDGEDTPQDYTKLDAYSRSLLSPEELAVLEETEDDAEATDADESSEDEAAADEETVTAEAPVATAETAEDEDKPVAAEPKAFTPEYQAALPENFNELVADIAAKQAELRTKLKAGELDIDEFDTQNEALIAQREDLRASRIKAEISQEMAQQSAAQRWESAQKSFFERVAAEPGFGDYRKQGNEARVAELDTFIKALAADKANEDKPVEWFLDEAHRRTKVLNGLEPYPQKTKKPTAAEAVAARKPDMKAVPKTLAQVPGGDGPGDVGDEFADLDNLDGPAMEAAYARMSESQRERFARGGR
jgi:hypothetical protein